MSDSKAVLRRRPVVAWALYDWANSAFACTVMAGFFPVFFKQYWNAGVPVTQSTARLAFTSALASLAIAVLAPVLGAIADRSSSRLRQLFAFTLLGSAATIGLALAPQGGWLLAASLFLLASLGFWGGIVFSDSLLLHVAEPEEYDLVSGFGYALGYLGGGLLFAANVVMTQKPEWFGLANAAEAVRWSFVTVGVWWLVFSLPLFRQRQLAREGLEPVVRSHEITGSLRDALFQVRIQPAQRLFGTFALTQLHFQSVIGHLQLSRPRRDAKLQFGIQRDDRIAGSGMFLAEAPLLQSMPDRFAQPSQPVAFTNSPTRATS